MGIGDEIDLVVGIGPVVGIGLFGGTGLVVSLTYLQEKFSYLLWSTYFQVFGVI